MEKHFIPVFVNCLYVFMHVQKIFNDKDANANAIIQTVQSINVYTCIKKGIQSWCREKLNTISTRQI